MFERRNQLRRAVFGGLVLGAVAGLLAACIEVASLFYFRSLPATGSKAMFLLGTVGLLVGLGPIVGLLAGFVTVTVTMLLETVVPRRLDRPRYEAWVYTLLASPFAAFFATRAFSGRRARQFAYHDLYAIMSGLGMLVLVWIGVRTAAVLRARYLERRVGNLEAWGWFLIASLAASGLHYADRVVLPGLYPFFHSGLAALVILFVLAAVQSAHLALRRKGLRPWAPLVTPLAASSLALVLLVGAGLSARILATRHSLRPVAFRRTVLVSEVVRLASTLKILPSPRRIHAEAAEALSLPPPSGPRLGDVNVVLITIDALRADHIGLYGQGKLTPNIDRIFSKGIRFDWAYTPMPQTSYAVTSLLTGAYLTSPKRVSGRKDTLADVLRRFGYKTACFYPPAVFYIDRSVFSLYEKTRYGFEYYRVLYHKTNVDDDAAGRTDDVVRFVRSWRRDVASGKEPGGRRLFLWIHYFDPHHPYQRRSGFGPSGSSDRDRYDSEVAYVDAQVGRLHGILSKMLPNTVFFLTADHGEAFGEHDTSAHGTSLYVEQARVPLLAVGPGLVEHVVSAPVGLVDVAPTILTLLDFPIPVSMEGTDRTAVMAPRGKAVNVPVFSELLLPGRHLSAVALGAFRLIMDLSAKTMELYDHSTDPEENHPLNLDSNPKARKRAGRLLGFLERWNRGLQVTRKALQQQSKRRGLDLVTRLRSASTEKKRAILRTCDPADLSSSDRKALLGLWKGAVDPEVRHRLAILLAGLGQREALETVGRLVKRPDLPMDMLWSGALVLAKASDRRAVEPLMKLLSWVGDNERKKEAIRALGRLGDVRAGASLVGYIDRPGLASQAALALGDLGSRRFVPALIRTVHGPYQALVRQAAARSLGRLGGKAALRALADTVARDPRGDVVAAALAGLAAHGLVMTSHLLRRRGLMVIGPRDMESQGWHCMQSGCIPGAGRPFIRLLRAGRRREAPAKAALWILVDEGGEHRGLALQGAEGDVPVLERFEKGRVLFGRLVADTLRVHRTSKMPAIQLFVVRNEAGRKREKPGAGRRARRHPGS